MEGRKKGEEKKSTFYTKATRGKGPEWWGTMVQPKDFSPLKKGKKTKIKVVSERKPKEKKEPTTPWTGRTKKHQLRKSGGGQCENRQKQKKKQGR